MNVETEKTVDEIVTEGPAAEKTSGSKKKRVKKDEFAFEKDIRYRGPLSYRWLKLLGWVCIVLSQVAIVEGLKLNVCGTANGFFLNETVMSFITPSALPLLLISIFAYLLQKRDNYKNTIMIYGVLSLVICGLFVLIYARYILGITGAFMGGDRAAAAARLDEALYGLENYKGFIAFNIFIDVFLCTLIMFFLDYTPTRFFTGKKIHFFRALVILPLAYEFACIILKILCTDHLISLPLWVSPFLTTKPPVSILMFLSIVRYIKLRERRFFAAGRTSEQYREYLDSNKNSLEFSKHLMLIIFIYALLDLGLFIVLTASHVVIMGSIGQTEFSEEVISEGMNTVSEWGFGGTARMIDILPIVLLFSYTRSHKKPLIDTGIPIAGVIAIVIIYLDGAFQMLEAVFSRSSAESSGMLEMISTYLI
ncbi:MAG: hypothetical protein IJT87_12835 [Ruminiclostridium sp.]|nr:hypothetical protein [Ruminiclostridium sp.]